MRAVSRCRGRLRRCPRRPAGKMTMVRAHFKPDAAIVMERFACLPSPLGEVGELLCAHRHEVRCTPRGSQRATRTATAFLRTEYTLRMPLCLTCTHAAKHRHTCRTPQPHCWLATLQCPTAPTFSCVPRPGQLTCTPNTPTLGRSSCKRPHGQRRHTRKPCARAVGAIALCCCTDNQLQFKLYLLASPALPPVHRNARNIQPASCAPPRPSQPPKQRLQHIKSVVIPLNGDPYPKCAAHLLP